MSEAADPPSVSSGPVVEIDQLSEDERREFENERDQLRGFVKGLSGDDIKSGRWFSKLIAQGLVTYAQKADWQYFQEKYKGVPADAIVDQRIKMASRYASLAGGLSATAYTGVVAATIGTLGGASPATVPAAISTLMFDLSFVTVAQLRLAHDVAVLYRVPIDVSDPDDVLKLIKVSFSIKGGELVRDGVIKAVPPLMRVLVKKYFSGAVLSAAKTLPIVGKYLLQRTVIKIAIPLVGIPLAAGLNYWTTVIAGRHARVIFRNEARVIEVSRRIVEQSTHPQTMLWVAWLVVNADQAIADDEALLLRHLMTDVKEHHGIVDEQLAQTIELEPHDIWRRLDAESGDLSDVFHAAVRVAEVDGDINERERVVLDELRERCSSPQ